MHPPPGVQTSSTASPTSSTLTEFPPLTQSIRSTTAPSNPTTATVIKPQERRHTHHIPHHPHRVHRHRHTHSTPKQDHRVRDKSLPRSTIHSVTSPSALFNELLSPISDSPAGSNRELAKGGSVKGVSTVGEREKGSEKEGGTGPHAGATWEDVTRAKERRRTDEDSLRSALQKLSALSTSTTRRLDYTYYSLLEHISALHSLSASLYTLSHSTTALHSTFTSSTTTLTNEVRSQIETAEKTSYVGQRGRIEKLEARLKEARGKIDGLSGRVEDVRGRVEGSEKREREWNGVVSRRLRMLWGMLGTGVAAMVVVGVGRHVWVGGGRGVGGRRNIINSGGAVEAFASETLAPHAQPSGAEFRFGNGHGDESDDDRPETIVSSIINKIEDIRPAPDPPLDEEPRLRIFDEL